MILLQGAQVGLASVKELLDQTSDPTLLSDLRAFLLDSPSSSAPEGKRTRISGVSNLRTYKSGALHLVDVVLDVAPSLSVRETASLERDLTKRIREAFPVVTEVAARFKPVEG
jgi:divalent metal cation (Fe/Co/Zn/Cd) transporter